MYIRSIKVRNYLIHRDTQIDLHPLTVFVGPQGGGKSALFDAMLNFSMVSRGNLRQAFGPYPYSFRATRHHGASNIARIGFDVTLARSSEATESLLYQIDYTQTGAADVEARYTIPRERLTKLPGNQILFDRNDSDGYAISQVLDLEEDRSLFAAIRHADLIGRNIEIDELTAYCAQQISRFNRFRLDPAVLGQPSRLPDPTRDVVPRIRYHGEDLAATLFHLSETQDSALTAIISKIKEVDAAFDGFEFNAIGTDRIGFSSRYSDSRELIPAVRLSSGTLNYLGLLALVMTPNRPSLLMIEEPENGLTPQAIRGFYEAVRTLALRDEAQERSQVLISSHSPLVICEAWNGEDRNFIYQAKVTDGRACVRRFGDIIQGHEIQLGTDNDGHRTRLSLKTAEEVMSGYWS